METREKIECIMILLLANWTWEGDMRSPTTTVVFQEISLRFLLASQIDQIIQYSRTNLPFVVRPIGNISRNIISINFHLDQEVADRRFRLF